MSRGRVMGSALMLGALVILVVGGTVAFDVDGDTRLGLMIMGIGLLFLIVGAYFMSYKPKKLPRQKKQRRRKQSKRR